MSLVIEPEKQVSRKQKAIDRLRKLADQLESCDREIESYVSVNVSVFCNDNRDDAIAMCKAFRCHEWMKLQNNSGCFRDSSGDGTHIHVNESVFSEIGVTTIPQRETPEQFIESLGG